MAAYRLRVASSPQAAWRPQARQARSASISCVVCSEGRHHDAGIGGELEAAPGAKAAPASISRWFIRNGYRFKKNASGQRMRSPRHVRQAREQWRAERQPKMRLEPHRVAGFLDETGTTTKMTRPRGRCRKGERLRSEGSVRALEDPDLHRRIALRRPHRALRHRGAHGPANFETYVETQLAPTLEQGDIVIMDNLPAQRSSRQESHPRQGRMGPLSAAL